MPSNESRRKKIIQRILWLAHETGREIIEQHITDCIEDCDLDRSSEVDVLGDIYKANLRRWRNHTLPMTSMDDDI